MSNKEFYDEVKEREEKAVNEKQQLDQKLKLQRVELQKQMSAMQAAEDKLRAELEAVNGAAADSMASLRATATATGDADRSGYAAEKARLTKVRAGKGGGHNERK